MSDHQRWLEEPYDQAEELAEADARAREAGYESAVEWYEARRDEAEDARWERAREEGWLWD